MSRLMMATLALLAAVPAGAQEWQVARDRFAFAGNRLTIRVIAEAAGTLQLIRGADGSVQVAGRARQGFVAAGLSSDEELTLSAVGPGPVQYLVSVPEDVWIEVLVPGRPLPEAVAGWTSGSFEWPGAPAQAETTPEWLPGLSGEDGREPPLYTTFVRANPPAEVEVPDLSNVRSLSVRIEGDQFTVATSRPLSVEQGSPDRFVIRPGGPAMEVVITLPAGTARFTLRAGHSTALLIDGSAVTSLCEPITEQWLSRGRRWLTFNPLDGSLVCNEETVRRHEG